MTPTEVLQNLVDGKRAEVQELRDKRRSGKPITTQLREIDARIKRKAEQLEKKDKALEALRKDRDEVEKRRAAIDQKEAEVVAEKRAAQEALDTLQVQRSQVEQLVVPEVQEAAKQRVRDQGVLLQQLMGFFTAAVDGKPGADPAIVLQNLQQLVVLNSQACQEPPGATGMETDGVGADGNDGVGVDGNGLDDEDFCSEDPAVGMGMEVPKTTASMSGARRGRNTGTDSPGRSRSASRRRRRDAASGNVEGGSGRPEGGGGGT